MTLAERYNATLLESARLLENADRLAVHNSALRAQLAAVTKERDEARALRDAAVESRDHWKAENARLRAAIAPTVENMQLYTDAGFTFSAERNTVARILAAIAARAGVKL